MSTNSVDRKVKVAVLGLGRMGKRHSRNFVNFAPRAELVAVADVKQEEIQWARENLPSSIKVYTSSEELLKDSDAEAVLVSTDTAFHADLAIKCIEAGKHTLIEKPISIDVNYTKPVVAAAEKRPDLKVMVAFSRRFDASYQEAARRIQNGQLGKTNLLKSCTNDLYDPTGYFLGYAKNSGGIFIDCGIHDIDIGRWLLDVGNPKNLKNAAKQVAKVYATGQNTLYPELAEMQDCDNALGIIEFENGSQMNIHLSRTSIHGHDVVCEVFGTKGKFVINAIPNLSRVEIRDEGGVRQETHPSYYERFFEAFKTELQTFSDCILDDTPVPTPPRDGLEAAQIAIALTHSFRTGKPVFFGSDGEPILE
ncbi:uncharacterized protein I303_103842 [Kwoniella dejecticola CBS 10117]|uniref:Oxidoreductase n=1 Tax=Kwoniella dejecticola CBS 10117 TaxID=1296121 RepID=A0A1A6A7W0_9TREE|nr:oxidoreductase [Kwoniella dejecticola CBS 10117]OBR86141.1 oxidoreductase [Kwoniella dejecticola CBS 10117]